ncbi:PREDICTED: uncharacterized protein LOC104800521 [Tarenaya hassleriana]|uniref:uncharacterized protein LOC104800521 n=1 Tax=Tarenaya hassleriana TaxID=28532 RepID=UPI00053C9E00|nr:PREDICTED: uncharacterized protein LOC104800521 [Tarenaya hassleriana]
MALRSALILAFFLFPAALSPFFALSASQFVSGKVSCSDCPDDFDFSGIKIMVSCENTRKRFTVTTTNKKGDFMAELPSANPSSFVAEIRGGPTQLYGSRKNVKSNIVKAYGRPDGYALSSPLIFSISCPSGLGSSKTVDLPLPPEWGLAPTSYYFPPFFPIIGIP